jgi:flagella basal body P-ring formation protein FlgA
MGRTTIDRGALTTLPVLEDVVGAISARDLEPGTVVTASDLLAEPLVRPGDRVHAVLQVGGARIDAPAVAVQSGGRNDVVSLVNPTTRKTFRGRVLGRGEVEVVDVR